MTPKKILVVDDSETIRDTLRLTLEFRGFEVDEAMDGEQGLARLGEKAYDLMLCDLAMPNMDGLSLIRRVRETPEWNHMPIIVLSAEDKEAKTRALDAGGNLSIDKPFAPKQVLAALDAILAD